MIMLTTYAHVLREEETDLPFAEFEIRDGAERLDASPNEDGVGAIDANLLRRRP